MRTKFFEEKDGIDVQKKKLEDLNKFKVLSTEQGIEKTDLEAKIKAAEDNIENNLKRTSGSYKLGTAIGDTLGEARAGVSRVKDGVLDATGVTGVKRAIGRGVDTAVKAVAEFADRPSIISTTKTAAANSLRAKKLGREVERGEEIKRMDEEKTKNKAEPATPAAAPTDNATAASGSPADSTPENSTVSNNL